MKAWSEELDRITRAVARAAFHAGYVAGLEAGRENRVFEFQAWDAWEGQREAYAEVMVRDEEAS